MNGAMNSKEKVRQALNHEQGAAIPVDFGSTAVTGIHVSCIENLHRHFDLPNDPVKVIEPYQMLGEVDELLKEAIGIDTVGIYPRETMFGFPNEQWRKYRTPWGQEVLVSTEFKTTIDDKGDTFIYPKGDLTAEASGRLPVSGFFFDTIIRQPPVDEDNLDVNDNLEEFGEISDIDLAHFKKEVEQASMSGKAVVATFGGTAFGDIALVPAPNLVNPRGIRDIEEWYITTAIRQGYVHEIYSKQCEIALSNLDKIWQQVGNLVDVVFICGTDFGTQTSSFCSTETFDELWSPYYKEINDWIHRNTDWKTFKHSCGAVEMFMPHFIESGFDIINPVQCSAAGMDPKQLKDNYGSDLVFWGGGVDTQNTLPFGTPDQVYDEVSERCEIFSKDGGFVFDAIHNIQARTLVENIIALLKALDQYR